MVCDYTDKDGKKCGLEHPVDYDEKAATLVVDYGKLKEDDYKELDAGLRKKLEMLNEKLSKHNSKWTLVSANRSADEQHKLHLCRIVSWGADGIKEVTKKSDDDAKKIYDKALELLKNLLPSGTTDDDAIKYAKKRKDNSFKDNPVAAGKSPCPCGCGFIISNHVSGKSADGNVDKIDDSKKGIEVSSKSVSDKPLVSKLSEECDLEWGGNWKKVDNVHWQLQ